MPKRKRALITFAVFSLCAVAWWCWLTATPTFEIPTPQVPRPNAYDTYQDATRKLYAGGRKYWQINEIGITSHHDRAELVDRNRTVLADVRSALPLLYLDMSPPPGVNKSKRQKTRSAGEFLPGDESMIARSFRQRMGATGWLLVWDGDRHAARNDFEDAASCYIDALELANQIEYWYGIRFQNAARKRLWRIAPQVSTLAAHNAALRLASINLKRTGFTRALQSDLENYQANYADMLCSPNYPMSADRYFFAYQRQNGVKEVPASWKPLLYALLLTSPKQTIVDRSAAYWRDWIRRASLPYTLAFEKPIPNVPIAPLELPNLYVELQCMYDPPPYPQDELRNEFGYRAETNLLIAFLALRSYRGDHGAYPPTLDALIPRYLTSVPLDPYATAARLKYRRDSDSFVLYSIGPDGADDGGRPIGNTENQCCSLPTYQPLDKGDIVVTQKGLIDSAGGLKKQR